ncbi:hypothetical protein C0991_006325 [Blastosporella zonata]|nr:hypothetical protein C0991_006325 [Blastosporella zonata]
MFVMKTLAMGPIITCLLFAVTSYAVPVPADTLTGRNGIECSSKTDNANNATVNIFARGYDAPSAHEMVFDSKGKLRKAATEAFQVYQPLQHMEGLQAWVDSHPVKDLVKEAGGYVEFDTLESMRFKRRPIAGSTAPSPTMPNHGPSDQPSLADYSNAWARGVPGIIIYDEGLKAYEHIPPEIIAEIFMFAFDDQKTVKFPIDVTQIPWAVGRVCAKWREIARADPRLWNSVNIEINDAQVLQQGISFLEWTFPSSGPLSMYLACSIHEGDALCRLILPYSGHLTTLELEINSDLVNMGLAKLPHTTFEGVVDMTLRVTEMGYPQFSVPDAESALEHLELFKPMKNLRKLTLSTELIPIQLESGPGILRNPYIPFRQLTHLDVQGMRYPTDADHFVLLLRQCTSLNSLLYPPFTMNAEPFAIDEELLPSLTSVTISDRVALSIPIPWARLTNLSLRVIAGLNTNEVLNILEMVSCLESLTTFSRLNDSSVSHRRIIMLADLHTLSISSQDVCVLRYLVGPAIREFHIEHIGKTQQENGETAAQESHVADLLDFLERSPHIEALTIQSEFDDENDFQHRTIPMAKLRTLHISSKDKCILTYIVAPSLSDIVIHLAPNEDAVGDDPIYLPRAKVLDFLERASRLGIVSIDFEIKPDHTFINLQPLSITPENDWTLKSLQNPYDGYLKVDPLPEDELRGFVSRSGCAYPIIVIHVRVA